MIKEGTKIYSFRKGEPIHTYTVSKIIKSKNTVIMEDGSKHILRDGGVELVEKRDDMFDCGGGPE